MKDGARGAGVLFLVFIGLLCPAAAAAELRVALVIGNAGYKEAPLRNPLNDAEDMSQALRDLGFEVIEVRDASRKGMIDAFNAFAERTQEAQVGLFYYAGHGVQFDGTNYLVPLHTQIADPSDLEQEAVALSRILGRMDRSPTAVNIVILDACRNNPYRALRGFRDYGEGGLARPPSVRSSLIAYATQLGNVAEDGKGRNGTYTKHLLHHIKRPGISLPDLFIEVGQAVLQETKNRQEPWVSLSPIPRFCLAGCGPSPAAVVTPGTNLPPAPSPVVPQTSRPSPPASAASLPPVAPTPTGSVSITKGPRINSVNSGPGFLMVGVMYPPQGDAVMLVNGKDVSALLSKEEGDPAMFKIYKIDGSPEGLNLSVGQNTLVMRYDNTVLPAFEFKYTAKQKEEAQRLLDQRQQLRAPSPWGIRR